MPRSADQLKSRLFIGSAFESLDIARKVQAHLRNDAEVTIWEHVFTLGQYTLERLLQIVDAFDFSIFIFTPDDLAKIRQKSYRVPRDNVVFELGLFVGKLGRKRCFLVVPEKLKELHLPTDLLGLTFATYDPARQDRNLSAALGIPCDQIRDRIKDLGPLNPHLESASVRLVEEFKDYLATQRVDQPTKLKRVSLKGKLPAQKLKLLMEE